MRVIALLCSDIHLSHHPPIARSAEKSWYEAMGRTLNEVSDLQKRHNCPILCGGDIFHHWNSPPELINFAVKNLPRMYAVPGQHDMPLHNLEEIHRSAYTTLVECGVILDLPYNQLVEVPGTNLTLMGFPFGCDLLSIRPTPGRVHIAVVHHYMYSKNKNSFRGASKKDNAYRLRKKLRGFDIVVVGDNHIPFAILQGVPKVVNCGSLMARHRDQIQHQPRVWLVMEDLSIKPFCLNTTYTKWVTPQAPVSEDRKDWSGVFSSLEEVQSTSVESFLSVWKTNPPETLSKLARKYLVQVIDEVQNEMPRKGKRKTM